MSEKTKRKQPPQTFRQKYRLLIRSAKWFAVLLPVIIFIAAIQLALPDVFYPFIHQKLQIVPGWISGTGVFVTASFLCILVLACISKGILCLLYRSVDRVMILLGASFVGALGLFMVFSAFSLPDGNRLTITDREVFEDHVYYIVRRNDDFRDLPPDSYAVYKCDSLEIRCGLLIQTEKAYWSSSRIIVDEDNETITFEMKSGNATTSYTPLPD